jgi:hypothetical protein
MFSTLAAVMAGHMQTTLDPASAMRKVGKPFCSM